MASSEPAVAAGVLRRRPPIDLKPADEGHVGPRSKVLIRAARKFLQPLSFTRQQRQQCADSVAIFSIKESYSQLVGGDEMKESESCIISESFCSLFHNAAAPVVCGLCGYF